VSVVDPRRWTSRQIAFLGANSEPEDIAVVNPQTAYVTRRMQTHLLRLNLTTGATKDVVDLSLFADSDGIPDLGTMAIHGERLFVQIRRLSADFPGSVPPFYIAVVDLRTETLVDVDPQRAGVQAIELRGTSPKHKMQVIPETQQLFVSATGTTHDAGGIEAIDLRTLRTRGLVIRESDGLAGADAGPFVMVTPERGYLVFTTDADLSSHLAPFTLAGGIKPEGDLYISLGYAAPGVEFDEHTRALFFPDGGLDVNKQGIYVFDAVTERQLAHIRLPVFARTSDILLIPSRIQPPRARARS